MVKATPVHALARHDEDLRGEPQRDAVCGEAARDDRRRVGVLARQHLRLPADQRHRGTQARKRLRHLAADRSGADDGEPRRLFRQREQRLVGEVRDAGEAGNRRHRGAPAGRNHRAAEGQRAAAGSDRRRPSEARSRAAESCGLISARR